MGIFPCSGYELGSGPHVQRLQFKRRLHTTKLDKSDFSNMTTPKSGFNLFVLEIRGIIC
jgi:hypothetical protein